MANTNRDKVTVQTLLNLADVQVNGSRPWDIQVHDERFYQKVLADGSLGLGESYMDGWWSAQSVDGFIFKILEAKLESKVQSSNGLLLQLLLAKLFNMQTRSRSLKVADLHYNLDNDLYGYMLGSRMSYTCAYWKNAENLEQAQDNKHDLICRKLNLKPGDQVLELGCGWGGFAEFAAKNYGVSLTSVNISKEQVSYAKERCKGLDVHFHLCDYRDDQIYNPSAKQFDKVVSIGMCEHVGCKNYHSLMNVVSRNLKKHGLFLLHTIGANKFSRRCETWTHKYIFPNGVLPSIAGLGKAMEQDFVMEDWHNFGAYYDATLMAWHHNFSANWDKIKSRYDERFYRMFTYYLLSCAGMFRARSAQLWQVVISKGGAEGVYESVR
ncbi:MAG: cfa [Gammaproteobacteria bacterium]|jgi:cyclopropane-fatty-acyl-phospholipid synthase|nr:cfa [Gammaproteobacteria bacterium]